MSSLFDLVITATSSDSTVNLRLLDAHGSQLAYRHTDFSKISASRRDSLFDLRHSLELLVEDHRQTTAIAEVGECIAQEVLGSELFEILAAPTTTRTLRIQLPDIAVDNPLAAQLARIPWEMARRTPSQPTLAERNLLVRVVNGLIESVSSPLALGADEPLRVLFVFAEARGSRPLEARQERRELLALFEQKIYPQRRVVAHFLSHGVTRERLETQLRENGGYHIVHWSGHGGQNQLELARSGGGADHLTGSELLDIFNDNGGLLPQLIFLSACNSGDLLRVQDWNNFLAVAQGQPLAALSSALDPATDFVIPQTGYTGTAQALLAGGVPSVVAMRYAVSDIYARELAKQFYTALLAYPRLQSVATALLTARQQLRKQADQRRFAPCDHATPVLYGVAQPDLKPLVGPSPALTARSPWLHQVSELTIAEHQYFVGRTWELAELGVDFFGTRDNVRPVAVITGLGGMGKTALTAEILALWEQQFQWVLLYQAKPNALSFELTFRDINLKLVGDSQVYRQHIQEYPTDAIYQEPTESFTGSERLNRLTRNLIRALKHEPILLVFDNFEANLQPITEPGPGTIGWACQDPAWDHCLAQLAAGLGVSPSRVLLTCRWPLTALPEAAHFPLQLGPLPAGEAALYVRNHPGLLEMALATDQQEAALVSRLLRASRFHPLLMNHLARLATGGAALRPQLLAALQALETTHNYSQLPDLFTTGRGNVRELAYLNDALTTSLDLLIEQAEPDARRLLWMSAIANEPVTLDLLSWVWRGESPDYQQRWRLKQELVSPAQLSPERQEKLKNISPAIRAELEVLLPLPVRPAIRPLLDYLLAVGLVTAEYTDSEDDNPELICHELVRERVYAWMVAHPQDKGDLTENAPRLAYAEWMEYESNLCKHRNMTVASEAGRRAVVYYVQARAFERLGDFVGEIITSGTTPQLLESLIPYLEEAVREAPEGRMRWAILKHLADALNLANRPDASLPFYEQAATLARNAAAELDGKDQQQIWDDVACITGNWGIALKEVGKLEQSRQRRMETIEAGQKAGFPTINIISEEVELLRLDFMQGQENAETRPAIEERLWQIQVWWQQSQSGQHVPEAPNREMLARVLLSALDIAKLVARAQGDWESALQRTEAAIEVKKILGRPVEEIARTRMNRAGELINLGRFPDAKAELESCLQVSQNNPLLKARVFNNLALLYHAQGDINQTLIQERRALAIFEQFANPEDRIISHSNLANGLRARGTLPDQAEAYCHQLTSLLYSLVTKMKQDIQASFHSYTITFSYAQATGTYSAIPRITELLDNKAFYSLGLWLQERQVNLASLQAAVDQFLEQARQAAAEQH